MPSVVPVVSETVGGSGDVEHAALLWPTCTCARSPHWCVGQVMGGGSQGGRDGLGSSRRPAKDCENKSASRSDTGAVVKHLIIYTLFPPFSGQDLQET